MGAASLLVALGRPGEMLDGGRRLAAATPGAGLRGMRERAESLGGHLDAGPTDDGWLVEAVLP